MLSSTLFRIPISLLKKEILPNIWARTIITGSPLCDENKNENENENENENVKEAPEKNLKNKKKCEPSLSLEYMESEEYKTTYGDKPVWHTYVRNFKGGLPPETRKTCMTESGMLFTNNPCPICRDQYLLPHYQNIKLLKQFISPYGGNILETKKTGVCQRQQFKLKVAVRKAQNYGLLKFHVPHRHYDYSLYNKK